MTNNNLTISRENAMAAYANADARGRELLENLFGKDIFVKQDITERVKTFKDACNVLGDEHPLVKEYWGVVNVDLDIKQDLIAYLKLRIITAALNECWEPQFTEDECRYYPVFEFFTKNELNKMSDDKKGHVAIVSSAYYNSSAGGYIACAYAGSVSSFSFCNVGSRLNFKTRELAEYAGRQFITMYADFVFPERKKTN